jgi:hypothetical protein
MAANTVLNAGTGGDTIQTVDNTTFKTQVVALANSTGANITAINAAGEVPIIDMDTIASGSLTATGSVTTAALNGVDAAGVQVTGTWVGTLIFEGSVDGTNYFTMNGTTFASTGELFTGSAANGQWQIDIGGVQLFRVRCSAFTSGTIVITIRASAGCSSVSLDAPIQTMGLGTIGLTGDSGAKTATGNGATQTAPLTAKGVVAIVVTTPVTGTTPTCAFKIQCSLDAGTNWVDSCATGNTTAAGTFGLIIYPTIAATSAGTATQSISTKIGSFMAPTWRVAWTIGGTTPSFTISSIRFQYLF